MGNKKSSNRSQKEDKPHITTSCAPASSAADLQTTKKQEPQQKQTDGTNVTKKRRKKKKIDDEHAGILIMDNGSYLIKAGFCGDSAPRSVFPPIVGTPKHPEIMVATNGKDVYVGDEAQAKRGILTLNYPIKNGIIDNWDHMEKIWHHTFYNELRIDPVEHPLLLTESPLNPKPNREKTVEIIFEKFCNPSIYLVNTALCALIASGRYTGVVLESGYQTTHAVAINEGFILKNTLHSIDIGGKHVTEYLVKLLDEKGYNIGYNDATREIIKIMKHDLGFIPLHYDDELKRAETSGRLSCGYELPDGQIIGYEGTNIPRFKCTQCLFDPKMIDNDGIGISKLLEEVIRGSGKYMMDMCANIVISGGNTKLDGFGERIKKDVSELVNMNDRVLTEGYVRLNNMDSVITKDIVELVYKYSPQSINMKCIEPPERGFSVWIGGSVVASTLEKDQHFITKSDYDELGVNILNRKCIL